MNIDGHQFKFPDNTETGTPKIEKIDPAKNPTEHKTFEENLKKFLETEKTAPDKEGSKQKSQEELKKEKNEVEGKGRNLDITT